MRFTLETRPRRIPRSSHHRSNSYPESISSNGSPVPSVLPTPTQPYASLPAIFGECSGHSAAYCYSAGVSPTTGQLDSTLDRSCCADFQEPSFVQSPSSECSADQTFSLFESAMNQALGSVPDNYSHLPYPSPTHEGWDEATFTFKEELLGSQLDVLSWSPRSSHGLDLSSPCSPLRSPDDFSNVLVAQPSAEPTFDMTYNQTFWDTKMSNLQNFPLVGVSPTILIALPYPPFFKFY